MRLFKPVCWVYDVDICIAADKKHTHSGNEEASDDEVEYDDEEDHAPSFYDKSKSFFDNISCDATAKASYRYHCTLLSHAL